MTEANEAIKTADATNPMLRIVRSMPAPPRLVFDAWTDPKCLEAWFCPGPIKRARASLDVRVGGQLEIVMSDDDGDYQFTGEYKEISPPDRLVFTWSGPKVGTDTVVTVEFRAEQDGTELILTHERLASTEIAEMYELGWGSMTEKLAAFLEQGTSG